MSLARILLKPAAHLAGMHASRQLSRFINAHQHTEDLQNRMLLEMVRASEPTAFGRDHDFSGIRNYQDFTQRVPVSGYDGVEPYIKRVLEGETQALIPPGESVLMFAMTSGTTGEPKYIPVTNRFLSCIRRGWNIWGLAALRRHAHAFLRPVLQISSPMRETLSPCGVPCGAISGLLAETQKRIVRRMYVRSASVNELADPDDKFYCILRLAIVRDVAMIVTANPSSIIKLITVGTDNAERLIRDIHDGTCTPPHSPAGPMGNLRPARSFARSLERKVAKDGMLHPSHFWNVGFLGNWTGGTLKLYLPRLRELFPDVPIVDIGLLASEGRFSVPLEDSTPSGVAEITSNFLEFLPDGEDKPMRAHQLEVGQEYTLIITNWACLWRYNMDDRVRVTGYMGNSPVFEFLSRGRHTANMTGEKLTEQQVVEAMRRASADLHTRVERFVMQGCFADVPYYEVRIAGISPEMSAELMDRMDHALWELNMEYRSKRATGRLGPLQTIIMSPEEMEARERENIRLRRGRTEQYKHKYLLTEVLEPTQP